MPTYLYLWKQHGEFESEHSIKEKLEFCPMCEKENIITKVTRLIVRGANFILKGSGWAKDNYS